MKIIHFGLHLFILTNCMFLLLSVTPVFGVGQIAIRNNFSNYTDSLGYFHIVGEVENTGRVDVKFVRITATCYDSKDTVVGTKETYTSLSIVPATRRAPFHLMISPAVAGKISRYSLRGTFQDASEILPRTLVILSHEGNMNGTYLNIVGEVQNNGTQISHSTRVVTTCYDNSGKVVAVDFTYLNPRDLDVGAKVPFKIIIDEQRSSYVIRYEVQVESNEAVTIPEFSSIILVITSACFLALLLSARGRKGI